MQNIKESSGALVGTPKNIFLETSGFIDLKSLEKNLFALSLIVFNPR